MRVKTLEFHDHQHADRIALVQAASQCQLTIDDFWKGIQKYQPHLRSGGSGSRIKDSWMKIKWAVCKVDDLVAFRAALQGHSGSIQILLLSIEMKQSSIQDQRQTQQHKSLAGLIQDMSFQWMAKFSVVAEKITSCFAQGKQLLDSTANIMRTNIQIFQAVLDLQKVIVQLPGLEKPVLFWDAKGRYTPFHLQTIDCLEALLAILKVRFKDSGLDLIEEGKFALSDPHSKRDVDLAEPWIKCFRPGQTIHMSMVFELSTSVRSSCPACQAFNSADNDQETECINCGVVYQRVTDSEETKSPSQSKRKRPDDVTETSDYFSQNRHKRQRVIQQPPITRSTCCSDDGDLSAYARIRVIDASTTPRFPFPYLGREDNLIPMYAKPVIYRRADGTKRRRWLRLV